MTNSDIALKNSNGSHNLHVGVGSTNRGDGSQDGGVESGIRRYPAEFNP